MRQGLFLVDPATNRVTGIPLPFPVAGAFSTIMNGKRLAVLGRRFDGLNEIWVKMDDQATSCITSFSNQLEGWPLPVNDTLEWQSRDGTVIQGISIMPRNFDTSKKHPLLVLIHGGPDDIDLPEPVPAYVYPVLQWCAKGVVILRVNYRGSNGYGEKFRSLNVGKLGIGDSWDILSGINYLISKGWIDTSRIGCMGWSEGGFISAFLATNTHLFKAVSAGEAPTDWRTYYVNTDVTPFARQFMPGTPWNNPKAYEIASPITNVTWATTPTLIQHCDLDKRVPIANANELYRGLLDNGVTTRMIVYNGFGHLIDRPKEMLAATWHNWQWFNFYLFGEKEAGSSNRKLPVSDQ